MLTKTALWRQISRKTLLNGSYITLSRFANYILLFIFTMFNARTLGVGEYGRLSYYLAVTGIVGIFFTMGMDVYIVIQIARDRSKINYYLSCNFVNRTIIILVLTLIFWGINQFCNIIQLNWVSVILYLTMVVDSYRTVPNGLFQAVEAMHFVALFDIVRSVVLTVLFLILRTQGLTIIAVAIAYLASSLAALGPSILIVVKKYGFRFQRTRINELQELIVNSFPFFLNSIVNILAMRIDLVMINRYMGNLETGYYNSAKKLYETTMMVPNIMTTLLLPKLSNGSIDTSKRRFLVGITFSVGLVIGIFLYFFAGVLVTLLFGNQFKEAVLLLQILALGIPIVFLNYFYGSFFAAVGARNELVVINIMGTVFNIIINFLLIPGSQAQGAAWAAICSIVFTFILNMICTRYKKLI